MPHGASDILSKSYVIVWGQIQPFVSKQCSILMLGGDPASWMGLDSPERDSKQPSLDSEREAGPSIFWLRSDGSLRPRSSWTVTPSSPPRFSEGRRGRHRHLTQVFG